MISPALPVTMVMENQGKVKPVKCFVTGKPGVGKTTLLIRLSEKISHQKGGFFTAEIREHGIRTGFRIQTFDGKRGILADLLPGGPRVGKYRVRVEEFEKIGVECLANALRNADVILLDEIGKMELQSPRFRALLPSLFHSPKPLVATFSEGLAHIRQQAESLNDARVWLITPKNRDALVEEILSHLGVNYERETGTAG